MTPRQQFLLLAALLVLVALAVLFPRPAGADEAWRDSAPALVFTALRAAPLGLVSGESGAARSAATPVPALHQPRTRKEVPAVRTSVKPSPPVASLAGTASWWASFGDGVYAALPGYVAGTHVTIRVCAGTEDLSVPDGSSVRCTTAPVITSCQCYVGTPQERIVDLSPGVLAALGLDPRLGLFHITLEVLHG